MLRKTANLAVLDAWQAPDRPEALRKTAHRVTFDYDPRPGYLYVRSRAISSRANDNHDEFPAAEIEKSYRTFLGKPVFVNHHNANHRRARGVIVATALHRDKTPEGRPDTWAEVLMEIDARRFPKLAKAIVEGRVDRTSMGVDVEESECTACGNKATDPAQYCSHLPALKGRKIRRRGSDGKLREEIIREICRGLSFFENSLLVEEPADPSAYVLDVPDTRGLSGMPEFSAYMSPRSAAANRGDGLIRDAVLARNRLEGELTSASTSSPDGYLRQQIPLDDQDISLRQRRPRVPAPRQAPAPGHHVSRVAGIRPQSPVHGIHAQDEVALVQDDLFRRDRAAQQLPSVPVRPDARSPLIGQREARVAGVEGTARPGIAEARTGRQVDAGEIPLGLRRSANEAPCRRRPADHGAYVTASLRSWPRNRDEVLRHLYHDHDWDVDPSSSRDYEGMHDNEHQWAAAHGQRLDHSHGEPEGQAYPADLSHWSPPPVSQQHLSAYVLGTPDTRGLRMAAARKTADAMDETPGEGRQDPASEIVQHLREMHGAPENAATLGAWQAFEREHGRGIHGGYGKEPSEEDSTAEHARWLNHRAQTYTELHEGLHLLHQRMHGYHPEPGRSEHTWKYPEEAGEWEHEGQVSGRNHSHDLGDPLVAPPKKIENSEWLDPTSRIHFAPSDSQVLWPRGHGDSGIPSHYRVREFKRDLHPERTDEHPNRTTWAEGDDPRQWSNIDACSRTYTPEQQSRSFSRDQAHDKKRPEQQEGEGYADYHERWMSWHDQKSRKGITCPECGGNKWMHAATRPSEAGRPTPEWRELGRQAWDRDIRGKTGPFVPELPHYSVRQEAVRYESPADHPFFQANPVRSEHIRSAYHDSTADERNQGHRWYSDAHHVATAIAGGDSARGAGLVAAYSPRTTWPANLFNASKAHRENRAFGGPGEGAMGMHRQLAERIIAGQHHSQAFAGSAPKISAFAHLIEHGGDTEADRAAGAQRVVVDRHALSAAIGRRVTDADLAHVPIDKKPYYDHVAGAYRQAAADLSADLGHEIAPHQVQATVWLRQLRRNTEEDRGQSFGGRGRIRRTENDWTRWNQHAQEYHPEIGPENMHRHGYNETKVPPQIDTLRSEECPVCGETQVWTGQRCPVCGYVSPPDMFRDPDTSKAQQVREQLEGGGGVELPPEGQGSWPDADAQLYHPDQVAPDGVPGPMATVQDEDQLPQDEEDEAADLGAVCPACGTQFGPDEGVVPGDPCPECGQAELEPAQAAEEEAEEEGELPPGEGEDEDMAAEEGGELPPDEEEDEDEPGSGEDEGEDRPPSRKKPR